MLGGLKVSENQSEPKKEQVLLTVPVVIDFPEETFRSIRKLGNILRKIRRRMESEGYTIKDGVLLKKQKTEPCYNFELI